MEIKARVIMRRGMQHQVENGHPWVYKSEVDHIEGEFSPGDMVDIYNYRQRFIGRGFINPRSQILVRLLSRQEEEINEEFIKKRLMSAWRYRQKFVAEPEYCRVVFGEADFLPGLIIDRFGPYLVLQTLALGIDLLKPAIISGLSELFAPAGIFERNDVPVRKLEGLELQTGYLLGEFPTLIKIKENGIPLYVDIGKGQKTGYFYDQRENRAFINKLVPDGEVLDCFCHTGSFAVHAAVYGAKHVTAVDISEEAVQMAKRNAELNAVSHICDFQVGNAFDVLRAMSDEHRHFDVVILDPPAFTKSRSALTGAVRGYKEINLRGLKLVRPGGYLVTCSCSYHMDRELFRAVIVDAARDAKRVVREVEYRRQAKDHPVLPAAPETEYLKFMVLEVQ